MNKRFLLVVGLMMALSSFMQAQKECNRIPQEVVVVTTSPTSVQSDDQDHPYGGTFQIICDKNAGKKEVFTTDLLKIVEDNRLENKENIVVLSPVTRLRILSKEQIASQKFQPIEKLYSFE